VKLHVRDSKLHTIDNKPNVTTLHSIDCLMTMFSLIVVATDAATDDATNDRLCTLFATAPRLFEIENRPIDDIDAP